MGRGRVMRGGSDDLGSESCVEGRRRGGRGEA